MKTLQNFNSSLKEEFVVLFREGDDRWQFGLGYNAEKRLRSQMVNRSCPIVIELNPINSGASVHQEFCHLISRGVAYQSREVIICRLNSDSTLTKHLHLKTREELQDYARKVWKS